MKLLPENQIKSNCFPEESEASPWTAVPNAVEAAEAYGGTLRGVQNPSGQTLDRFSFRHRIQHVGPITLSDIVVGDDFTADCGYNRSRYFVTVVKSGRLEVLRAGRAAISTAGEAAIISPPGDTAVGWAAKSKALCLQIDRYAIEDALGAVVGREILAPVEFGPTMSTTTGAGRAWATMFALLAEQLLQRDGVLHRPTAAMPFVDSLLRSLLIAADHSHRSQIDRPYRQPMPKTIRTVMDIIEAQPHIPMTTSWLAARAKVSTRSLQLGFRRTLGMTPMAYLRAVRLSRAHQALLDSDPLIVTVRSIASQWGFTNFGRFAAMHVARYGETPSTTLRRSQVRATRNCSNACRAAHPFEMTEFS